MFQYNIDMSYNKLCLNTDCKLCILAILIISENVVKKLLTLNIYYSCTGGFRVSHREPTRSLTSDCSRKDRRGGASADSVCAPVVYDHSNKGVNMHPFDFQARG